MKAYINNIEVEFKENQTILEVARAYDQFIPTLCELADINHNPGTCRVCLVEAHWPDHPEPVLVTSCNTPLSEGMRVLTRTPWVREQQRLQVELLLADHDQDCATCIRHGDCELQDVAQFVGLRQTRYHIELHKHRTKDRSSHAVVRDMTKCIRCLRCVTVCREVQGVDAMVYNRQGVLAEIAMRDGLSHMDSDCVSCGQCIHVCPVGALAEKDDTERVVEYLFNPDIVTVFQFAPAVRVALGEEFGLEPGVNVEGRIISALRHLGADIVLDTNFAADLVIMEEGTELLNRVKLNNSKTPLPMFTSCCPAWINFAEKLYPEILPHISSTQSPQQCLGSMAKTYLAESMDISPKRMRVVSIMPCTAKKDECARTQFMHDGSPTVDVVLTTRELSRLLKREGINLAHVEESDYNDPFMGDYSGAAVIFGATGGVMEAAVRTVYKLVTGSELEGVDVMPIRGKDNLRQVSLDVPGLGEVRLAVAHGLRAARQLTEGVLSGEIDCHFAEVMACPGGCMGGGGQPRYKKSYKHSLEGRLAGLYDIDKKRSVRQSHNNPQIQKLYKKYLDEPNSHKAHELLHTHYLNRKREIHRTMLEIWRQVSMSSWTHREYSCPIPK